MGFSFFYWCSVSWIDHPRPRWNLSFYFYWFLKWRKWCTNMFQLKWQCRNTVAIYKVLFPTYTLPRYNHWQQLQVSLSSPFGPFIYMLRYIDVVFLLCKLEHTVHADAFSYYINWIIPHLSLRGLLCLLNCISRQSRCLRTGFLISVALWTAWCDIESCM